MEIIIFSIVILFIFGGSLSFLYLIMDKIDKKNKEMLRELTIALKSKDAQTYVDILPNDVPLPKQEIDEFMDIDQVEANELLKSLK